MPQVELKPPSDDSVRAFVEQVLRIHDRFLIELVERFQLCPWAEPARRGGTLTRTVFLEADPPLEDVVERALPLLEGSPGEATEKVAFLIFPRWSVLRKVFESFGEAVRARLAERLGPEARVGVAAFHPQAEADLRTAQSLVPFLRRSPDPFLQLIPLALLEPIDRRSRPERCPLSPAILQHQLLGGPLPSDVRDEVGRLNRNTVLRHGPRALDEVFEAIAGDRDRAYRAVAGSEH